MFAVVVVLLKNRLYDLLLFAKFGEMCVNCTGNYRTVNYLCFMAETRITAAPFALWDISNM